MYVKCRGSIKMLEFLIDVFLEFLVLIGFRKKKKEEKDPLDLDLKETSSKRLICAGCRRELKEETIYEQGKAWCKECYKSEVLKIKT